MKSCFRCGRPLEDDEDDLCVSCKNPNKRTSVPLRPSSLLWFFSVVISIPLIIFTELSKNYLLCLWLLIPELTLLSISSYFELKYYNSGGSKHIQISDTYFKFGVIVLIISYILCLVGIIVGLIYVYSV